jgi:hypothetical protein
MSDWASEASTVIDRVSWLSMSEMREEDRRERHAVPVVCYYLPEQKDRLLAYSCGLRPEYL